MFRFSSLSKPLASAIGATTTTAMRGYATGSKDYYKVLGVDKNASSKDIKKAYRKRAMETHPDQGGDKDEFAQVSQAYEVLSSQEKRQMYDTYGADAAQGMGGPGGMGGFGGRDPADIFAEFFRQGGGGGGNPFGDMFGGRGGGGGGGPQKVEDKETLVRLSLEEVNSGVTKKVRIERPEKCGSCKGEGVKEGKSKTSCPKCRGSGRVVQQHSMGPGMVQQVVTSCPSCNGAGKSAAPGDECGHCLGQGYKNTTATVSINVPKGVSGNNVLVMQGEAGTMPNAVAGDLHVHIEVAKHRVFERKGNDLLVNHDCTLIEALSGFEKKVKLLDGRTITVKTPKGKPLKENGVVKIPNEGLNTTSGGKGDLYIITKVVMPSSLSEEQLNKLEDILGKPRRVEDAANPTTGTVMTETREALERLKGQSWSQTDDSGSSRRQRSSGRRAGGGGGGNPFGGAGGGQQAECVQQ